jgi:hypothetical protein
VPGRRLRSFRIALRRLEAAKVVTIAAQGWAENVAARSRIGLGPADRRLAAERTRQLRRAKAGIWLDCEDVGMHAAVVILNDALREALDRLDD